MWPNPQETADFVTFTEESLGGKLHFLYSGKWNTVREILYKEIQSMSKLLKEQ